MLHPSILIFIYSGLTVSLGSIHEDYKSAIKIDEKKYGETSENGHLKVDMHAHIKRKMHMCQASIRINSIFLARNIISMAFVEFTAKKSAHIHTHTHMHAADSPH